MTEQSGLSRRNLLTGIGLGASGLALGTGLSVPQARAAKELVVGFIYVGPKDDYGYNQAHAEAAAMLKKMPGVKKRSPRRTTCRRPWRA